MTADSVEKWRIPLDRQSLWSPVNEMLGNGQGLVCLRRSDGIVVVDSPTKQARESFAACDLDIPTSFVLEDYIIEMGMRL